MYPCLEIDTKDNQSVLPAMDGCIRNCIDNSMDPENCFLYETELLSLLRTLDTACLVGLHSMNLVAIGVLSF